MNTLERVYGVYIKNVQLKILSHITLTVPEYPTLLNDDRKTMVQKSLLAYKVKYITLSHVIWNDFPKLQLTQPCNGDIYPLFQDSLSNLQKTYIEYYHNVFDIISLAFIMRIDIIFIIIMNISIYISVI